MTHMTIPLPNSREEFCWKRLPPSGCEMCHLNRNVPTLLFSQYDRRFRPTYWWSLWWRWFYPKPRPQWVARVWLCGLEQWELPQWICWNYVWVWSYTELHLHEGEIPEKARWCSPTISNEYWHCVCVNRSTATTCIPGMSRPLDTWFVTSALIQTGKPCLSSSALWRMRRTQVLILSPSFWPITWPVPSSANSTLLKPGCCSVRSPSSQVHTEQVIENYSEMCNWSLI